MKEILLMAAVFFIGYLTGEGILLGHTNTEDNQQTSKSTVYTVKCVDDVLTGDVEKRGDRYYYNDKQIWLPLSQCVLEEK